LLVVDRIDALELCQRPPFGYVGALFLHVEPIRIDDAAVMVGYGNDPAALNSSSGLPVTTPGLKPWNFSYSLMIQAISRGPVFMSGAGMSTVGPITS
jgi:hypothetical protein